VKLSLPESLRAQILAEARAATPRECCGLVLGRCQGDTAVAAALHPARNLAADADRFQIDPADHFAAMRAARAAGVSVIGCYHSHPRGAARPSVRDLEGAGEENFLWLIATPEGALAAFVYLRGGLTGADLVTSSS
jgi:proteasome lid subunit RPN8/RPN11